VLLNDLQRDSRFEHSHRAFLVGQLRAVIGRIDILEGHHVSFDEESKMLFGVDVGATNAERFVQARREIDALLPGTGDLVDRYTAFEKRFVVAPDRLRVVFERAMEGCRRVTIDRLKLPADEGVAITYVHGMPWSAFTRYEGHGRSHTAINVDFTFTVDRLLDVACHETYPGHHAINVLTSPRIQPLFSPQSLRTEGAASYAVELAFPGETRLRFVRDELFPLARIPAAEADLYLRTARLVDRLRWLQADIARRYLDGRLEFARALGALEAEALMSEPQAGEMLKFFNQFRSYVVTYTVGRDLVQNRVDLPDETARWRAYERWIRP
jgi:hypothetical protein